jgi:hypothetical protein
VTVRSDEDRSAAFDLARMLRDPEFRSYMMRHGYVSGTTVVVAYDYEPVTEVFFRILNETTPPVVIAVKRPGAKSFGFVFMTIGPVEYDAAAEIVEDDSIGDKASIGMLYDTLDAHSRPNRHLVIPNEWQSARFKVGLAGANL